MARRVREGVAGSDDAGHEDERAQEDDGSAATDRPCPGGSALAAGEVGRRVALSRSDAGGARLGAVSRQVYIPGHVGRI